MPEVDIFLSIIAAIVYIVIFAACGYVLIYYQHPDDNATAYFPKAVVVLSLSLSITNIMMLPLDAASRSSKDRGYGGMPMDVLWLTIYIIMACFVVLIIPFAYFYYQSWDADSNRKQCMNAIKWNIIVLIVFAAVTGGTYIVLGTAEVPVDSFESFTVPTNRTVQPNACPECNPTGKYQRVTQNFQVSLLLYFISILAVFGGFLFIFFGGIGLTALPFDLIQEYRHRPHPITSKEYDARRILLGEKADELIKEGANYTKSKPSRSRYNEWKQNVFMLEEEFELTVLANKRGKIPVFFYYGLLALGIIGYILTLAWCLHIVLFKLFQVIPFLNDAFLELDRAWGFLGSIFFAIFALWLQWCVIKGNFAFGLRIPILFSIHPMKPEGTLMSGFLFNCELIMLSSVAVTQFCADSFQLYVRLTDINIIFNLMVSNLRILKWFWVVYSYAIVVMAIIAFIVLIAQKKNRKGPKRIQLAHINVDRVNKTGASSKAKRRERNANKV